MKTKSVDFNFYIEMLEKDWSKVMIPASNLKAIDV